MDEKLVLEYKKNMAALTIQTYYKRTKYYINELNDSYDRLLQHLLNTTIHLNECSERAIILEDTYSLHMQHFEEILESLREFPHPLQMRDLREHDIFKLLIQFKMVEKRFEEECQLVGAKSIYDIFSIFLPKVNIKTAFDEKYNSHLDFYNKYLVPLNVYLWNKPNNPEKLPLCRKLTKSKKYETIDVVDVIFPLKDKNLLITGYFHDDNLQIVQKTGIFHDKYLELERSLKYSLISKDFKKGFLEQLSLTELIAKSIKELQEYVEDNSKKCDEYRKKTISSLLKDVLLGDFTEQKKIFTLLLLDDKEQQTLATLFFDLISKDSDLTRSQPAAYELYKRLHWSLKKKFKIKFEELGKKIQSTKLHLQENDISYEQKLGALNVSDEIKKKGYEKLKEVKGSREGSNKAEQYLDGFLQIPFGIYKKETILNSLDEYKNTVQKKILTMKDVLDGISSDNETVLQSSKIFLDCFESISNNKMVTENDIHDLITKLEEALYNFHEFVQNSKKERKNIIDKLKQLDEISILKDALDQIDFKVQSPRTRHQDLKLPVLTNTLPPSTSFPGSGGSDDSNKYTGLSPPDDQDPDEILRNLTSFNENNTSDIKISHDIHMDPEFEDLCEIEDQILGLLSKWVDYRKEKKEYIHTVNNVLDECAYGHKEAKKQISQIIAQWMNGRQEGTVFGLRGPPGVGKTTLIKHGLSKCLVDENGDARPFAFIPLGGSSNGAILEGHSYTYVGSTWGRIIDILMETKCMNPIIYIDEIDKVSHTEHGKEIIGILTHITDCTQNTEFNDRYFSGIKFDLSKVLFVFSYNNADYIDPILRDRITEIKVHSLSKKEKVKIVQDYLLPEICDTVGFRKNDITMQEKDIHHLIETYTYEAGVRKLKEKLFEIVREINLQKILQDGETQQYEVPLNITKDMIDGMFSDKPRVTFKKIAAKPHIGLVNGLYATESGTGGLTLIEIFKMPSEQKLSLELTGQQGDVMKESMSCAKTVAWNLLSSDFKKKIHEEWKESGNFGLHIHCPEGGTPKDGPSAGAAITTAILSCLTNIPVNNEIAMTGEIDIHGKVHAIGGLDAKLEGARIAGAKLVMVPKENEHALKQAVNHIRTPASSPRKLLDSDILLENNGSTSSSADENYFDESNELINSPWEGMRVIMVDDIFQVLKHALVENDTEFVDYARIL